MANIKLNSLAKPKNIKSKPQFTYSDVEVDLKFEQLKQASLYSNLYDKDLRGNYDLGAIKNSITNIFTSFPGDKILNPEFGLNLNQFLFLPCSIDTATAIGNQIRTQLIKQEPRVKALEINVFADPDNDQYLIDIVLEVPFINNNNRIAFKALLNSTGINFYS